MPELITEPVNMCSSTRRHDDAGGQEDHGTLWVDESRVVDADDYSTPK